MLAYFNDELRDQYDWFIRLDDDSVLQWENLNELLSKLYPQNQTLIGSPGGKFRHYIKFYTKLSKRNLSLSYSLYKPCLKSPINSGYGRDEDDFIEENMVYCMGGTGIIYSNALVRSIRPHLPTCIKQLYTVKVINFY